MALSSRIRELETRHQDLEHRIQTEMKRPGPDSVRVTELKRQKLKLKEELEALRGRAPA